MTHGCQHLGGRAVAQAQGDALQLQPTMVNCVCQQRKRRRVEREAPQREACEARVTDENRRQGLAREGLGALGSLDVQRELRHFCEATLGARVQNGVQRLQDKVLVAAALAAAGSYLHLHMAVWVQALDERGQRRHRARGAARRTARGAAAQVQAQAAVQAQLLVKAGAHPPVRHEEFRNQRVDRREHALGHVVKARRIGLLLLLQYKAPQRDADGLRLRLAVVRTATVVVFDVDHHHQTPLPPLHETAHTNQEVRNGFYARTGHARGHGPHGELEADSRAALSLRCGEAWACASAWGVASAAHSALREC